MGDITFFEYPDPLVWWHVVLYLCSIAWGSLVIGIFGVGGSAIFVPIFLLLPGTTAQIAVGTIFLGVMPTTIFRLAQLFWFGRVDLRASAPLMLGALVGAVSGQGALLFIPEVAVALFVAAMAIWSGVQIQRKMIKDHKRQKEAAAQEKAQEDAAAKDVEAPGAKVEVDNAKAADPTNPAEQEDSGNPDADDDLKSTDQPDAGTATKKNEVVITQAKQSSRKTMCGPNTEVIAQMVVGFCSALISSVSGTGGPLIMFPIFLLWDPMIPMKTLVAHSGPFAAITVSSSAITNLIIGSSDVGMSILIGITSTIFMLTGGVLMERLGDSTLKLGIGLVLIAVGVFVGVTKSITAFA
mmetsp:Transcript_8542/g.19009  ORF Transcript_8542/g.19009 Transcript_8542/m.19009 type:complete len:353 (-) Transcript_8542:55-1113(-)|eukprot:CAMPEP_0206443328 /NCGR_PEP_ID=MMETSP0324_2-20121206/14303_1 /ASSEMBLY_ACC=CAM_ASM_000836 /TAXON_ID=2866 /ORGANISM="Crypthecodinium cohnii, Strain Seligo" /LENGTH=352 /DNA_ID=CAMNT_0053911243 /DNA_START=175 /DNA_END=1233 /DNA_ORIENTATION=-